MSSIASTRVVSGMRATGALHLGHYHGVLKNWVALQHTYDCFFFIADWHALTTHYENPHHIAAYTQEMLLDWIAAGVDPHASKIFVQSHVPEHAELHLLLSMITPLSWLERVPTYKDQQARLKELDLATYGFLGYPVLQSADILIYKATSVPVGEDQVSHLELCRAIARRFNYLYGREEGFEEKIKRAIESLGKKNAVVFQTLLKAHQEMGDEPALHTARALIAAQEHIPHPDKERLYGYLEGSGREILLQPEALLTKASRFPGLDGQKMSKSYHNTIGLREDPVTITKKIRVMPTDPARVHRTDRGDPDKCPVWQLHTIYSDEATKTTVQVGCRQAKIGCVDCKKFLIDKIVAEQEPMLARIQAYQQNPHLLKDILREGAISAREAARETLIEVRAAMGLAEN